VTFFAGPNSYTGENILEISVHGAPVLLAYLLRMALAGGARLAEPGEFTQRAFLAGRLDLTQAEAVHDLVAASTLSQAKVAAAQLGGALSHAIAPAKHALLDLMAALEAGIDFAEDDIDLLPASEIARRLQAIRALLQPLQQSFAYGRILRDGLKLALVGRPNAGKSTLFNRLLGQERAIVTAQPGTTRDVLAERLEIAGVPVELIDTAGLREPPEGAAAEAEAQGIARTRTTLAEADFVVLVIDAAQPIPCEPDPGDLDVLRAVQGRPHLVVLNKVDLLTGPPALAGDFDAPPIQLSASTGAGVDQLLARLADFITAGYGGADPASQALVTNLRQQQAVAEAIEALERATTGASRALHHEFLLLDLAAVLAALDALTGATAPDEVLHRIFATFCIGK
jgi:tRNA modification GTPase